MQANITLDHVISQEELLNVYRIFCESYNILIDEIDEEMFLQCHYDHFLNKGNLDHRPFMGAKFFGSGRNGSYTFHGYNDCLPEQEIIGLNFKTKVEKQFSKSTD